MQLFISSELEASRPVGQLLALRGSGMEGQDDTTVCSGSYLPDRTLTQYPICDQSIASLYMIIMQLQLTTLVIDFCTGPVKIRYPRAIR